MPDLKDPIPGFDTAQSFALRAVMREQADESAEAAVRRLLSGGCPVDCPDMREVKAAVFGDGDERIGMDERLRGVERSLGYAARALWIAIGAFIVSLVGLLFGRS